MILLELKGILEELIKLNKNEIEKLAKKIDKMQQAIHSLSLKLPVTKKKPLDKKEKSKKILIRNEWERLIFFLF